MAHAVTRTIVAVLGAVLIMGALAMGMAYWSERDTLPRQSKPLRKPVEIPVVKAPPKKKAETQRRRASQTQIARTDLPALNLSSAIAVPVFEPQAVQTPGVVHPTENRSVSRVSEQTVLTEEMVDEPPQPLSRAPLRYPKSAEVAGVEGEVEARLLLSAEGTVLQVQIVSAAPPGVFDAAAEESLIGWRFSPATFRGQKLKAWVRQRVVFKLH
ncbi:MAG: TonB family protein [Deltaproteobacteria bacterium]|nr:TonB family protein [Deltaproteobacteria bacterium]MBN2670150.1 TonB family protein [Deltaproteobacteria bacterium]